MINTGNFVPNYGMNTSFIQLYNKHLKTMKIFDSFDSQFDFFDYDFRFNLLDYNSQFDSFNYNSQFNLFELRVQF